MSTQDIKLPAGRRRFGAYPGNDIDSDGNAWGIPTVSTAYRQGYETGEFWSEKYIPGGPWVHQYDAARYDRSNRSETDKANLKLYCEATQENRDEWMRGFHDAHGGRAPQPPELYTDHIAVLGYN